MTSVEIKIEIQKVLDKVPENILPDVLDFLKELETKSEDQVKFANNLKKILTEDRDLLQKLAE
jgi:mRNA-degrading endonuclease RelE of RelBE toxin-antitoxin system